MMSPALSPLLLYVVQTDEDVYLVTDLATGGDLAFHMSREVRFKEDRARLYAAEVVLALEHLHSLGIVYRDLKVRGRASSVWTIAGRAAAEARGAAFPPPTTYGVACWSALHSCFRVVGRWPLVVLLRHVQTDVLRNTGIPPAHQTSLPPSRTLAQSSAAREPPA